jgi:hypothetical protein
LVIFVVPDAVLFESDLASDFTANFPSDLVAELFGPEPFFFTINAPFDRETLGRPERSADIDAALARDQE